MRMHMHTFLRLESRHAYFLIWFLCGLGDRREGVTGVQRPLEDSPAPSDDVGQLEISAGASQVIRVILCMAIKISNFHHISILYLTVFDANTANTRLKYKYKYATFKILRYKYKYS